jgi:galactose oxidase
LRGTRKRPSLRAAALALLAGAACGRDTTPPEPAGIDPSLVAIEYLCGRTFQLGNGNPEAVTIAFEVVGTGEAGELTLPAAGSGPSVTRLTTLTSGSVRLTYDGVSIDEVSGSGTICPSPSPAPPEPQATAGMWTAPFAWPVVAVHLHLLPTERVLSWGRVGEPQIWDPATGGFAGVPSSTHLFCAGHTFLSDGRLLVAGGHLSDNHGLPDANLFDPITETWTPVAPMAWGRWYPTTTTLADGRVITLGGTDQDGADVPVPELWSGNDWIPLITAARVLPYYPRTFVAPNGLVFYAGELKESGYLDPSGSGSWIPVANSLYGQRDYGSAAMYLPGKVLIVGGSNPPDGLPTNTAEVIDLTQAAPSWQFTDPMAAARRQFTTTLLPDGRVVATGGTSAGGFTDPSGAVHAAEVWDPATGEWTTWASNSVVRVYHSTTLLLPDGRLLHAGSGDGGNLPRETSAELFSPPYLFRGPRPSIASGPQLIVYGESFAVATPDAGVVTRVTLVRLGSVTHAFDQNQRFNELTFRRSAGGVTVTAPVGGAVAPPGHYMLFLLSDAGVPSIAAILRLGT